MSRYDAEQQQSAQTTSAFFAQIEDAVKALATTLNRTFCKWVPDSLCFSPWKPDEPWDWYGKATKLDVWSPGFLAVESKNRTHLASANPGMVSLSMALYDNNGNLIDWYLTPRNSTALQKAINSGAAKRDFYVGDQIPVGTPYIEFNKYRFTFSGHDDGAEAISALNLMHLTFSTLSMASASAGHTLRKVTDKVFSRKQVIMAAASCVSSLFNTVDYYPESNSDNAGVALLMFLKNNGTSLFETLITDCIGSAVINYLTYDYWDALATTGLNALGEAFAKFSNPVGWAIVVA